MTSQQRPSGAASQDDYRILRDADLRDYLAQLPTVASQLGGSPTDWSISEVGEGRKIRVLTIVDTFSRFSPAVDPRFSYRGEDVVLTLERVCKTVGCPKTIRVDQGSEFVSRDLDIWAYQKNVILDFSRPGKPTDNSFIESFNGKFRSECLNTH